MEELFDLIQSLISTQDEFKQAILNEVDATRHPSIILTYSNLEKDVSDKVEKLQRKLDKEKEDKDKEKPIENNNNSVVVVPPPTTSR